MEGLEGPKESVLAATQSKCIHLLKENTFMEHITALFEENYIV